MQGDNRREFIRKLAKGVAYTAPVLATFPVPDTLLAQGISPSRKDGMTMTMAIRANPEPIGPAAPGSVPRPGES